MDVVTNSLKYFPVATGEASRDLIVAVSKSGKDAPKPTPAETFLASHPAAGTAGATARTPSSLARQVYDGVNAFVLVDAAGRQAPDYLMSEIRTRLAMTPVTYKVLAQIAEPADATNDATKP